MSGSTINQGYPYPLTSDFLDVQDAYRLAMAIDADIRAAQAPFRAFEGSPAFAGRQTSNGSGFISGTSTFTFSTADYDNTGGITIGANAWRQPTAQQPSWWLFGATLLTFNSGTPVVGEMVMARLRVTTTDQVTGVSSATNSYQRNDESNTAGEWLNVFTMAPVYRASATLSLIINGTTTKGIAAGSTFWGLYLGPVT